MTFHFSALYFSRQKLAKVDYTKNLPRPKIEKIAKIHSIVGKSQDYLMLLKNSSYDFLNKVC
ncbi:MAG: hypothetical protein D6687_04685 [Acidobacteria bacterium]|nr:MAG: hypothetical protein D6687_04685 [Acidobacteriota bacterium]